MSIITTEPTLPETIETTDLTAVTGGCAACGDPTHQSADAQRQLTQTAQLPQQR